VIHASKIVVTLIRLYLAIIILIAWNCSDIWPYDIVHIFKILTNFIRRNKSWHMYNYDMLYVFMLFLWLWIFWKISFG